MRFDFLERMASHYLPIWGHVSNGAWLLDDGSNFGMIEVQGIPWETCDLVDNIQRVLQLNHTYKQIASASIIISIYQTRAYAPDTVYPARTFQSSFSASLNEAYRTHLFDLTLYENRTFIGIQIRPERYAGELVGEQLALRQKPVEEPSDDRLRRLEEVIALLMVDLKPYRPRRLGVRVVGRTVFSEIAEALMLAMTGIWRPIGITTGRLGEALFSEQIVIDKEFIKYVLPGKVWYAAGFGMKHFPQPTQIGMYARLMASSYLSTIYQSFRFIATNTAQDIMRRKRSRLLLTEDPAEGQAEALRTAASNLANADYEIGDYAFSLLTFANSPKALTDVATAAWADLASSGMTVAREMAALEAALFSLVPGNARLRPRPGYVSSLNLACMAPLHAHPIGEERGHWGAPIAVFRSRAGTPIYFHWQCDDVGNTLITGMTTGGKTLLTGFLMAMTESRARIVALDHKRGWQMLIPAMDGRYTVLGAGTPNFAPLKSLTDDPEDVAFLMDLIRGCIVADGHSELTAEQDARLAMGIRMVMSLDAADRSMSEVRAFLGIDPNGPGARLEKWCHGKELGWVIDAPRDAVSLKGNLHGLDTTSLLDVPRARGPALLYLFYRIRKLLTGEPLLLVIDEGWRVLLDDVFRPAIEQQLRTIRSKNGAVVFITQGAGEILDTRIRNVLVEQCPNQIHLPNPRATEDDYCQNGLKRTRREFEVLKRLRIGSGEFLLCRGAESMVAQLPLHGMDDFIAVLSSRESTLKLYDAAVAKTKGNVQQALPLFHAARKEEALL